MYLAHSILFFSKLTMASIYRDVDVSIGPLFEREIDHIFEAAREHGVNLLLEFFLVLGSDNLPVHHQS